MFILFPALYGSASRAVGCPVSGLLFRLAQAQVIASFELYKAPRRHFAIFENHEATRASLKFSGFQIQRCAEGCQARVSRMILRLSSADSILDPLALTPGGMGTEAVYTPPDSATLAE